MDAADGPGHPDVTVGIPAVQFIAIPDKWQSRAPLQERRSTPEFFWPSASANNRAFCPEAPFRLGGVPQGVVSPALFELFQAIEIVPVIATVPSRSFWAHSGNPENLSDLESRRTEIIRQLPADDEFLQKGLFGLRGGFGPLDLPGHPLGRDLAEMEIGRKVRHPPGSGRCGRGHTGGNPWRIKVWSLARLHLRRVGTRRPAPRRDRLDPGQGLAPVDGGGVSGQGKGCFWRTGQVSEKIGQATMDFRPQSIGGEFLFGGGQPAGNKVVGVYFNHGDLQAALKPGFAIAV